MVREVNADLSSPIIDQIVGYGVDTFERVHSDYIERLREHIFNRKDIEALKCDSDFSNIVPELDVEMSVVDMLLENAHYRGYLGDSSKQITMKYYFGKEGVVIQVIDQGVGFDAQKVINAFEQQAQNKGEHYQDNGWAMRTLLKPEFHVNIQSSTDKPTGTTVTLMYKYQHLK